MKAKRFITWKKLLVFATLALGAVTLSQGEQVFNQLLRGYLAVNGVHGHFLQRGATTLFYFEGGKDNPRSVILLHGVGGNALSSWFRLMPALAGKYHVVAPDLFFSNLPDLIGSQYHIRAEERLVEVIMDETGIERASLVGLSFGAWPALQTAMDRPGCVEKLVLVSPLDGSANAILDDLDLDRDDPGKDFYYRIFESPPPVPGLLLLRHWDRTSKVFNALPSFRRQLEIEGRVLDMGLGKVKCPTLVVHGKDDRIIPVERFQALAGGVADGRELSLDACGHAVVWDQPGRLEDAIAVFLSEGGE